MEVTATSVDRKEAVLLLLEDLSVPDVGGHGVLAETLVSPVNAHGVVSIMLTVVALIEASVDGQETVSLSLEDASIPEVGSHGVLAEMLVSFVN